MILNTKISKLVLAISAVLATPALMAAEVNNDAKKEIKKVNKQDEEIERITVTGIKGSLSDALLTKRGANNILDAISAEDIGSFPDNNVAESLQRVPGVSITRGFGEGQGVSVRGFAPGMNLTLVNGQTMASSSFQLENTLNRGFNYSLLPSVIVKRLEVYKSPEAKLPDGGVGGTINVQTRKPLEEKNNLIAGSISGVYNDLSDKTNPKGSILGNWKNKDETFGMLVTLDHQTTDLRRDAVEVLGYIKNDIFVNGEQVGEDTLYPRNIGSALFQQERERNTGMVTFQWRPTDELDITLNSILSKTDGDNTNYNLLSYQHSLFVTDHPRNALSGVVIDDSINTATRLDFFDNPKDPWKREAHLGGISREAELETKGTDLSISYTSDNFEITATVGTTKATHERNENALSAHNHTDLTVGIDDGVGYAQYHDLDLTSSDSLLYNAITNRYIADEQEQDYVAVDMEFFIGGDFIESVEFGAKYQEMSQEKVQTGKVTKTRGDQRLPLSQILSEDQIGLTPSDYLSSFTNQTTNSYILPDINAIADWATSPEQNTEFVVRPWHRGKGFDIEEELTAAYAQANYATEYNGVGIRGNFGVRVVDSKTVTKQFSKSTSLEDELAGNYDYRSTGSSTEVLPSANVNFDFQNDTVLRVALSRVMSRPGYTDLARTLNAPIPVIPEDQRAEMTDAQVAEFFANYDYKGQSGNADLDPFKADKLDLSYEVYYGDASSVSLAAFYFDVQSFIFNEERPVDVYNDGRIYTITQPVNGEGGTIKGLEFAFLHNFDNGLGVQFNYTYADSSSSVKDPVTEDELPLAGLSEDTFNAVVFYSKDKWNARLAYNYRSDFFEQIDRGVPRFREGSGFLTSKVSYRITDHLTAFISGNNLLDTERYRYIGTEARPFQTSTTGRVISAGIDFKF
ncbi:TonB-dependent receptor [Thalassotalea sp. ND16A]|uniref:TonB-dependent receptor n=1 Tax=Thalassotalea sp. ND16A TaxID=1535422 RepID=UPI00051A8951|nr:TonB-dependent receptor [Thalassotalea sp. ND16A]KGK00109.1 hypothetical protein ND16A_0300 [Thalassotalea sp. ND16A]